ncbi:MAG: hypothetical protein RBU29_16450 [bacterium]|nr:hypothetical protein [bacterium]
MGYSRKIFHFAIFTLAGLLGLVGGFPAVQVFGTAIGVVVVYAVWQGESSKLYQAVARPSDAPYERFYILVPFLMTALGGMVSNLCFGEMALIGYITTGWGDAVGEPAGTRWGKHKYRAPSLRGVITYRSWEGSLAVFLASLVGCVVLLSSTFPAPLGWTLTAATLLALCTTLVEALTFHSMDNLTIQVATSALGYLLLKGWG